MQLSTSIDKHETTNRKQRKKKRRNERKKLRDGPLENLWGGGLAKYKKSSSRKGKLNEKKIPARQLTVKNIHAMA